MIAGCRCSHRPRTDAEQALLRWPPGTLVTWSVDASALPPGVTPALAFSAASFAAAQWAGVCGAALAYVADPAAARIAISYAAIDPTGRILGLTEEPEPGVAQVRMRLNNGVYWDPHELTQVNAHEMGHALGVGHSDPTAAVMFSVYQPQFSALQPWDIAEAQAQYGLPGPAGAPSSPSDEPAGPASPAAPDGPTTIHVEAPGPVPVVLEFAAAGDYVIRVEPA
jgi:hypothetical protein